MLLSIEEGDVLTFQADVLAFKYARGFHGADEAVARVMQMTGVALADMSPPEGTARLLKTRGAIGASHILFVGVPSLRGFRYPQIRAFATSVMRIVAEELPAARHIAMTVHGVNYGLDESESLLAQVGGLVDALMRGTFPARLERVSIVERRPERRRHLRETLARHFTSAQHVKAVDNGFEIELGAREMPVESAGAPGMTTKPHVFVAMPFVDDKEDVFYYGIQGPVHALGFTCERIDIAAFTGDIVEQIKQRIETAALVIADLSLANPNVYLEVGYAWGKGRPTLLLVDKIDELRFDVKGHRCIAYKSIKQLESSLAAELQKLKQKGVF